MPQLAREQLNERYPEKPKTDVRRQELALMRALMDERDPRVWNGGAWWRLNSRRRV